MVIAGWVHIGSVILNNGVVVFKAEEGRYLDSLNRAALEFKRAHASVN
jgi:hypothetical protein